VLLRPFSLGVDVMIMNATKRPDVDDCPQEKCDVEHYANVEDFVVHGAEVLHMALRSAIKRCVCGNDSIPIIPTYKHHSFKQK
jgi:hypothetical protein